MEKPENKPQASQAKMAKPNGANGHVIPAKFSKAPLFHTHRRRDKNRLLNASAPTTPTPSPPHPNSPSSTTPAARPIPRQRPAAVVKTEADEVNSSAFNGPYQEFRLMSSNLNGWKYDVMKLESRKPVDVELWQHPIKLNRKDPKRVWETVDVVAVPQAVGPMLGPDGKPVIGADGKVVMVDAEGRPIHGNYGEGSSGSKSNNQKAVGGRKKFQKKTKQVFLIPEATRMLRKEERYPWVLEDGTGSQVWTGMLEDLNKAETHAMFLPTAENVFKFVPPHRWYKFQKRPTYKIPSLEEAEKLMAKKQKNPDQWLASRGRVNNSDASGSAVKSEESVNTHIPASVSLVHSSGQSLGPGGRKLKAVDSGMNGLFGDDDEEDNFKKKREKEYGGDGGDDEIDFEEDFADDEEKNPEEAEDDEAKELEERIKKEYRKANTTKQTDFVEDSDDDEEPQLTGAGIAMQKVLRKTDKSGQYDDSDDEKNPYASSEEEEEEEPTQTWTGPAIQAPPPRPGSSVPPASAPNGSNVQVTQPSAGSRAASPTLGGHSLVAIRATSPKAPKGAKTSGGSSPLAHAATQPNSRATSPLMSGSRAGSPTSPGASVKVNGTKRKASEDQLLATSPSTNGPPKAKKRKGSMGVAAGDLDDKTVIEWLRNSPNATTRDCIHHFTPYLTDETKKSRFTALIKELAQLKGGVLVLRNAYRGDAEVVSSTMQPV